MQYHYQSQYNFTLRRHHLRCIATHSTTWGNHSSTIHASQHFLAHADYTISCTPTILGTLKNQMMHIPHQSQHGTHALWNISCRHKSRLHISGDLAHTSTYTTVTHCQHMYGTSHGKTKHPIPLGCSPGQYYLTVPLFISSTQPAEGMESQLPIRYHVTYQHSWVHTHSLPFACAHPCHHPGCTVAKPYHILPHAQAGRLAPSTCSLPLRLGFIQLTQQHSPQYHLHISDTHQPTLL